MKSKRLPGGLLFRHPTFGIVTVVDGTPQLQCGKWVVLVRRGHSAPFYATIPPTMRG